MSLWLVLNTNLTYAFIEMIQARKELFKQRNLVKLQAAVRGHLVRQYAVGTLRCVQAIVKMQALVHSRLLQQGSSTKNKIDGKWKRLF